MRSSRLPSGCEPAPTCIPTSAKPSSTSGPSSHEKTGNCSTESTEFGTLRSVREVLPEALDDLFAQFGVDGDEKDEAPF